MTKLTRAEFIARAVADRRKDKLRGQKYPDFKIVQKQGGLNQ